MGSEMCIRDRTKSMDWHFSVCTDHKILDNEAHDEDESFLGFREISMEVMNVPRQNFHEYENKKLRYSY